MHGLASAPDDRPAGDAPAPDGAAISGSPGARIAKRIAQVLRTAPAGMVLGVAVLAGDTGEVLYEHGGHRSLIPASNMKVFTVGASLARLGANHTFRTEVLGAGPLEEGVLKGAIVLRGSGDPSLTTEDLWGLAIDLQAQGIRRVEGDLLLDDGAFDRAQAPAAGLARHGDRPYGALTSALTSNFNTIAVEVAPGPRAGDPVRVVTVPPMSGVRVENRAVTAAAGKSRGTVAVSVSEPRGEGTAEVVSVSGSIPVGAPARRIWRAVGRPALVTGLLFKALLERADISIQGSARPGRAPAGSRLLARRDSAPLAVLLRDVGKRSNNLFAEQILKALSSAQPGSTRGGIETVQGWLEGIGIPLEGVHLADGSGLSRENRATALDLARALRAGARDPGTGPEFRSAFAVAGLDGTLEKRLVDLRGRVRGKTGYLTGVSTLSGWTITGEGGEVFFAVIANKIGPDPAGAKSLQDRIVRVIAETG